MSLADRYLPEVEVWCTDAPTHLIHFDGERSLDLYEFSDDR